MDNICDIVQCPETGAPLHWAADGRLTVGESGPSYFFRDGVAELLPGSGSLHQDAVKQVQDFYETVGWKKGATGAFGDTRTFVDTRQAPLQLTRKCLLRLGRHFARGGKYLLDAGSGPIAHDELLSFGRSFEKRVCVDLSTTALRSAQEKLGERGYYAQGDLTKLPLKTGSMDAVTCNHVIYQIPPEHQKQAFLELYRVLKPGGVAVIIYWWPQTPLAWRIERVARMLGAQADQSIDREQPPLPSNEGPAHHPLPRSWFDQQDWPFNYKYDIFRVITNDFMKHYVRDDFRGRLLLDAVYALQCVAPEYCGKHGAMPAIVVRKT